MSSVYLHIPFCERICTYCDFPKRVSKTQEIDRYLLALKKEVDATKLPVLKSLYIGGGTPSLLNTSQLNVLHEMIRKFEFQSDYEFTIEANPEHLTKEKIQYFKEMGVNRISLGVQTFNERALKLLNRGHNEQMVKTVVRMLKQVGMDNISIDLIYAIPFQTMKEVQYDLEQFKQLDIPHVSAYSLILEAKTVFEQWLNQGKIRLVDNEIEAEMYQFYMDELRKLGYHHYEISNFAKPTFESKHNRVYWENKPYYGFGMGASGYLGDTRYYNESHVNAYIDKVNQGLKPIFHEDVLSIEEQIKEALMLGLRLIDGLSIEELNRRYKIDVLTYFQKEFKILQEKSLIEIGDRLKLSPKGLFFGNEVFTYFL